MVARDIGPTGIPGQPAGLRDPKYVHSHKGAREILGAAQAQSPAPQTENPLMSGDDSYWSQAVEPTERHPETPADSQLHSPAAPAIDATEALWMSLEGLFTANEPQLQEQSQQPETESGNDGRSCCGTCRWFRSNSCHYSAPFPRVSENEFCSRHEESSVIAPLDVVLLGIDSSSGPLRVVGIVSDVAGERVDVSIVGQIHHAHVSQILQKCGRVKVK